MYAITLICSYFRVNNTNTTNKTKHVMKKKIDLRKLLQLWGKGTKLYSPLVGEVEFERILDDSAYSVITYNNGRALSFTSEGLYYDYDDAGEEAECLLFPSAEQRDWSKFTAPWYKKEKFDPETLKPFDKVLVRDTHSKPWICSLFSHIETDRHLFPYATSGGNYSFCIPFNEETKHLVGTTEEAPEFYRYWED